MFPGKNLELCFQGIIARSNSPQNFSFCRKFFGVEKMAYQPIYATVSDNQGYCRGTSCLRGRVDQAGVWVNSWYGTVLKASVRFIDCEMPRIERKGLTLEQYREKKKAIEEDVDSRKKVVVNIDLEANDKFEFVINGIPIPIRRIKALHELEMKRFEIQLDALTKMRDEGKQLEVMQLATQILTR